ncbi:MAG: hypothetical protein GWN56_04770, partial [Nitrosopumilaceae archaeon]|nr:hypothetical protein [Nitrosopumilaceae archaeon]
MKEKWLEDEILDAIELVCDYTKDEEKRQRMYNTQRTIEKYNSKKQVRGFKSLPKELQKAYHNIFNTQEKAEKDKKRGNTKRKPNIVVAKESIEKMAKEGTISYNEILNQIEYNGKPFEG